MSTLTLLSLAESLLRDLATSVDLSGQDGRRFQADMSRDISTFRRRFQGEGDSFFSITLPRLGKHILLCLEEGSFTPLLGFSLRRGSTLPCLLHGWLERIFCPETGVVLQCISPDVLRAVRQITVFASKAKELPSEHMCRKALRKFKEVEDALPESLWSKTISTFGYSPDVSRDLHSHVDYYWRNHSAYGRCFLATARTIGDEIARGFSFDNLRPKHGPGAVAERLKPDDKWRYVTDYRGSSLPLWFPTDWTERPFFGEALQGCNGGVTRRDISSSRLILVPKTAVTPRLIAAEPVRNQFWQQALLRTFANRFRQSWLHRSIDMTDQSRSADKALAGSTDRSFCTIDLSDASDTVRLDHLGALLHPGQFLDAIFACRTPMTQLPDGSVIRLKKFASMGSAVCFPVESAVFLAACVAGMLVADKLQPTTANIKRMAGTCIVYGDDIVVPNDYAAHTIECLKALGFKPNTSKSYWKSYFREACGGDYFRGVSVKPIYLRVVPRGRVGTHDTTLSSLCAFARQCQDMGYRRTRTLMFRYISRCLGTELPYSENLDGFVSHNVPSWKNGWSLRYNVKLYRWEFSAFAEKTKTIPSRLNGTPRLVRNLMAAECRSQDSEHRLNHLFPDEVDLSSTPTKVVRLVRQWIPNPYLASLGESAV